jgi:hypothetical protein
MGSFSLAPWLVVLAIVLLLFGAGLILAPWAISRAACARSAPAWATSPAAASSWSKRAQVIGGRAEARSGAACMCSAGAPTRDQAT